MSMKKTLVAAAILAVSGSVIAADATGPAPDFTPKAPTASDTGVWTAEKGDWAKVTNLKWEAVLTPQIGEGSVVLTDENSVLLETGVTYDLGKVNPDTLAFEYNTVKPAYLWLQAFEDITNVPVDTDLDGVNDAFAGDGVWDSATESLTGPVASAQWEFENFSYLARAGAVETVYTGDITLDILGTATNTADSGKTLVASGAETPVSVVNDGEIRLMMQGENIIDVATKSPFAADPAAPVGYVTALLTVTATVVTP